VLFSLIYASVAKFPDAGDIDDILTASKKNNADTCVTGALVCDGMRFLQILEGERIAVSRIFSRISKDDRHNDIVVISASEVTHRLFAEWQMAFLSPEELGEIATRRFSSTASFRPDLMTTAQAYRFMEFIASKNLSTMGQSMPGLDHGLSPAPSQQHLY